MDFVLSSFLRRFSSVLASCRQSNWSVMPVHASHDIDPSALMRKLVVANHDEQNLPLLQSMMQMAFHMMDEGSAKIDRSEVNIVVTPGTVVHQNRPLSVHCLSIASAKDILFCLFSASKYVPPEIVDRLMERVDNSGSNSARVPAIQLLKQLIDDSKTKYKMNGFTRQIMVREEKKKGGR